MEIKKNWTNNDGSLALDIVSTTPGGTLARMLKSVAERESKSGVKFKILSYQLNCTDCLGVLPASYRTRPQFGSTADMSDTSPAPPSSSSPATLSLYISDVFPISSLTIYLLPQWLCIITLVSLVFYSYAGNQ